MAEIEVRTSDRTMRVKIQNDYFSQLPRREEGVHATYMDDSDIIIDSQTLPTSDDCI